MEQGNNYARQARQARAHFLIYDQQALIRKLSLRSDECWLYSELLCKPYRIHRSTGDIQRLDGDTWVGANSYNETMTLLDLICDSRENRCLAGRWKQMQSFGQMFHRNLLEETRDPFAEALQRDMDGFRRACIQLKGRPMAQGDVSFAIALFDGLDIWLQFWSGDEEFPPRVRYLWDENALMYLKYETMHFAVDLLRQRVLENMQQNTAPGR